MPGLLVIIREGVMSFIKDKEKYRLALLMRDAGLMVIAGLYLRAAYGVE